MARHTVTIPADLATWLSDQSGPGKRFASFSHGVQVAVQQMRERTR